MSLDEQPDLLDISTYYQKNGGEFWLAVEEGKLLGTIALMNYGNNNAVMKKFFVRSEYRRKKVGYALYQMLIKYAKDKGFRQILLDTPAIAKASHRFYEKAGFKKIIKSELPCKYDYPDRDSYLYLLLI